MKKVSAEKKVTKVIVKLGKTVAKAAGKSVVAAAKSIGKPKLKKLRESYEYVAGGEHVVKELIEKGQKRKYSPKQHVVCMFNANDYARLEKAGEKKHSRIRVAVLPDMSLSSEYVEWVNQTKAVPDPHPAFLTKQEYDTLRESYPVAECRFE